MEIFPQFVHLCRDPVKDTYQVLIESYIGQEYIYHKDLSEQVANDLYDDIIDISPADALVPLRDWVAVGPHVKHTLEIIA